jgi:superfamily II DNA or RNA helicase
MAHRLARHLRGEGVRAVALDGTTAQHVQRQALADFERGEVEFLSSCDLLTEGVDLPSANCILFARPTKSQIVYSQAIGRGTRLSPETDKVDCLVLDLVGATNKFDLVTLGDLVGVKELKDGETIVEAVEREKKEAEEAAVEQLTLPEIATGEVVGREVDLFQSRAPEMKPLFEWQIYPEHRRAVLAVAGHKIELWRESADGPYRYGDFDWRSRFEGQSYNKDEAKAACEAEARRLLFGEWANDPATDKQISLMNKNKIRFRPGVTKSEASMLLKPVFDRIERAKRARATV